MSINDPQAASLAFLAGLGLNPNASLADLAEAVLGGPERIVFMGLSPAPITATPAGRSVVAALEADLELFSDTTDGAVLITPPSGDRSEPLTLAVLSSIRRINQYFGIVAKLSDAVLWRVGADPASHQEVADQIGDAIFEATEQHRESLVRHDDPLTALEADLYAVQGLAGRVLAELGELPSTPNIMDLVPRILGPGGEVRRLPAGCGEGDAGVVHLPAPDGAFTRIVLIPRDRAPKANREAVFSALACVAIDRWGGLGASPDTAPAAVESMASQLAGVVGA